MGLRVGEFDKMHTSNQIRIVAIKGIPVIEQKLTDRYDLILYSVYNFFVEAIVDMVDGEILSIERLSLDQVVTTYCEDIPSYLL